jgi:ABC-2 type transport system permease protein
VGEAVALFGVYRRLVGARIRSQLQYRFSFALSTVGTTLITFVDFAAILVIFGRVDALGDWSVGEVAFLYAISSITFGLADLVIGHLDLLPRMIRQGELDVLLVRPLGSLFQILTSDFALRRLGKAFQGLAVLVYALLAVDIDWTLGRIAMLPLMVVAGIVIFCGVWVAFASIAFWLVDSTEVANAFTYGGNFLAQYPVNIYGSWLRRLVIFVIPIAFVAYLPTLYVLDKEDPLALPKALQFASPLVAVVTGVAGGLLWRAAVRRYRSVGS